MSITPVSLTLPYQGRTVVVDDVSRLQQASFFGERCIEQAAREIVDSNFRGDLIKRVCLIHNTMVKHLPEASRETENILKACLKTAFNICLIAATIISAITMGPVAFFLGFYTFYNICMSYLESSENYIFPERRIQEGRPAGPWFCPNMDTPRGKTALLSFVWPIIGGLVLPIVEACTRKSRWENVLAQQNEQLVNSIPSLCEFYKQHGEALIENLNEKIRAPQDRWSTYERSDLRKALQLAHDQMAFLRNFDPTVPDLNAHVRHANAI